MSRSTSAHAQRVVVPEQTLAVDTMANPNYAAAWEVVNAGAEPRSAEHWARATFEDAPKALRAFLVAGWTAGLGLRLGPRPSPDHVLGWQIESATDELIILSVRSILLGTAHLVLQVDDSRVLLASFVRYEKPGARPIWAVVQPLHHRILPFLLGRAASR